MSDEEFDPASESDQDSVSVSSVESVDPVDEYKIEEEEEEIEREEHIDLTNSLVNMHSQEVSVSYEEVLAKCTLERDADMNIVDHRHTTVPYLTKYEFTRILGLRATQIEQGAPLFVKVEETMHDSYLIAKEELYQKKLPFILARPIPHGETEYWKLSDLEILY
jgi:DNA-directed RNA polymerase subunit K/omega